MTKMKSNETSASAESPLWIDQLEKTLLETRAERKVIETINFAVEGDWVEHKKVLRRLKMLLGEEALKIVSKEPKMYFDNCPVVMYREKKNVLYLSTMGMDEKFYIDLHDREVQLVQQISKLRKAERSRKRKREEEARLAEVAKRKKSKTDEGITEADGAHIKSFILEDCCAIFSDAEFAREMGVLNKGIKVQLDLTSMRAESIQMVFPLKCWVNAEEMPLTPDEVRKYGSMDISDDESDNEQAIDETNSNNGNSTAVESCMTFNHCRVYRKKKAKSKYEIGTLHIGNKVDYSVEESGGGWFKVLTPLPGWITYAELSLPELTKEDKEKLAKQKKAKEVAVDLTADTTTSKEASVDTEPKDGEKNGKINEKINGKEVKTVKKKEEKSVNGTTNGKNEKPVAKEGTGSNADNTKEEIPDDDEVVIPSESDAEEECTDDDWDEFEDPDEENLSGNWSCGQKGGCFTLKQEDGGVLSGYLENKETCAIDGKVEGDKVIFNQKWQKGSVHGIGVVTVVKGTHSSRMRCMNVSFECTNNKGKKITGKNLLYKDPASDVTGIWYSQEDKHGFFVFKMSEKGKITGFTDSDKSCKISGRVSSHHVKFTQAWQVKPSAKSGLTEEFLTTSVEGVVNDNGSKMCLTYSHPKTDGTEVTGEIILRKKSTRALAGLWLSGDQGGRFVFVERGGQKFSGYLDTNETCRFLKGVVDGFSISFRQVWLAGSAHKGAIAEVKGKANESFTKLQLTYSCKKKNGKVIKGTSVLNKLKSGSDPKKVLIDNSCFNGIHSAFPQNVFKQFEGFKMYGHHSGENRFPVYTRTQKIIILGEADFSFTLAMMRAFKRSFSTIIGTSYMRKWGHGKPPPSWNSDPKKRQFLNESLQKLDPTLDEIVERGGYCRFGVDARNLEATLFNSEHSGKWCGKFKKMKFDRVIFPFPRASLNRFDRVDDTDLMRGTFRSTQKVLNSTGELHIIMHTSRQGVSQLDLWKIRDLAEEEDLVWRAALPFDPKKMPAYNPKDVTGRPWRPYEPRVHVFTPRYSDWRPEHRSWRH